MNMYHLQKKSYRINTGLCFCYQNTKAAQVKFIFVQ